MEKAWWILAVAACSAVAAAIAHFTTKSRAEVRMAKQREELAGIRAALGAEKSALEQSLASAEQSARSKAMDEFIADIRVEERHYTREHKAFFLTRKCIVRQERIFFRNLPLSNWIEHEMPYEEGADVDALAKTMSVFVPEGLLDVADPKPRKLIRH